MANVLDDKVKTYEIQFKNVDYVITMSIESSQSSNDKLCLEIEEKLTSERWKGSFDSAYVEDLTRKTGNFKQFLIFVNMLETSLSRTSDSVSLELFTYNDLEQLRNKKINNNSSIASSNNNNNKRYLILTYNVEFDRINYPLQLNYQGKPDPVVLLDTIRKLKNEIKLYKSQSNSNFDVKPRNSEVVTKLQRDYERILAEKEAIKLELEESSNKLKECMLNTNETMTKEIKSLKQMIKNIEEDSLKEKTAFQKQLHKRIKENNQLIEEINEIRANERSLKHQINSLQTELSVYRRNRVFNNSTTSNNGFDSTLRKIRSRESSREGSLTRNNTKTHKSRNDDYNRIILSRESSRSKQTSGTMRRPSLSRERSISREREIEILAKVASGLKSNRSRSSSYDRTSRTSQHQQRSNRIRTPSPSHSIHSNGSSGSKGRRRFNPTEYIKDKNKKLEEIELKKRRNINRNMNNTDKLLFNNKNSKFRTPSVSSINSGIDSDNDSINSYESKSRSKKESTKKNIKDSGDLIWSHHLASVDNHLKISTPNNTINGKSSVYKRTKKIDLESEIMDTTATTTNNDDYDEDNNKFNFYNREKEIKEIDSRLKNLQLFMKNNMP